MRPPTRTLERLRRRARLLGQKHTALAERYLEEGVRMDEHPGIHFVDGPMGRRPAVIGTGLDVWEIIEVAKHNDGSVAETAAYLEIDPRLVETAMGYYGANRDEIDDWIARTAEFNELEEARWRAAGEAVSARGCCSTSISRRRSPAGYVTGATTSSPSASTPISAGGRIASTLPQPPTNDGRSSPAIWPTSARSSPPPCGRGRRPTASSVYRRASR